MSWRERVLIVLDEYAAVVVVIALVVAAMGGWIAYDAHAVEHAETETVVVDSWTERGSFSHGAAVTEPNPVFRTGTTLRDRSRYYTEISPVLAGGYRYRHTAEEPRSVRIETVLVLRSVDGDGGVYWHQQERLNATTARTVPPDEPVSADFEVDTLEVRQRIAAIEEGLGAELGSPEAAVVARVVAEAPNGSQTAHSQELVVDPGDTTYSVETPEPILETHESTEEKRVEAAVGPARSIGGPLLVFLGVSLAVCVVAGRWTGRLSLSPERRARIAFERERADLDDWISSGSVPPSVLTGERVQVSDLGDLVDLAIDADARVIEDERTGRFYVIDGGTTYTFSPGEPARPDDEAIERVDRSQETVRAGTVGGGSTGGQAGPADAAGTSKEQPGGGPPVPTIDGQASGSVESNGGVDPTGRASGQTPNGGEADSHGGNRSGEPEPTPDEGRGERPEGDGPPHDTG